MFCSSCGNEISEGSQFCGKCGAKVGGASVPPLEKMENKWSSPSGTNASSRPSTVLSTSENEKLLILFAHFGGIFLSFIPALIVFVLKKDMPGVTLDNAREALNWQLSLMIYSIVAYILSFVLIGFLIFAVLIIMNIVLCILASIKSGISSVYQYPFSIRLIKP
jgi:uncharacterized protein